MANQSLTLAILLKSPVGLDSGLNFLWRPGTDGRGGMNFDLKMLFLSPERLKFEYSAL